MSNPRHTTPQADVPRRRSSRKAQPAAFPALEPFARRLEALRLERRLTQHALAQRARISTKHYREIAHAHANPSVIVLLNLATALGVSLLDLFDSPPPADEYRTILVADLKDLAATLERFTAIVKRLAPDQVRRRLRPKRLQPV